MHLAPHSIPMIDPSVVTPPRAILVLGGYGLIGREITTACLAAGHRVTGAARSPETGRRLLPGADWIGIDLNTATRSDDWLLHLDGVDTVINASGALQSGGRDDLGRVQRDAIRALVTACETAGVERFVQISAPGAAPDAATEFMATKGEADDTLRASALDWVILKPGLVIAPTAYGGTSLLRTLAAFPNVQPIVLADAPVQTVAVADVARAAVRAATDPVLARREFDLVEGPVHTLVDVVLAFRRWLGFGDGRLVRLPLVVGKAMAASADFAGRLGWRPPLRSTSLAVLAAGVTADPEPWRHATGETLGSLAETLARMPATRQERQYARAQLLFPSLVVLFAVFWLASGLIGLWRLDTAAKIVTPAFGAPLAKASVVFGGLADIAIGAGLLIRRTFQPACLAAITLSLAYLSLGTLVTPDLWSDPLGPLVKIIPVIALAALLHVLGEER